MRQPVGRPRALEEDDGWEDEGQERAASGRDMFLITYVMAGAPESEWAGMKRDALLRFRALVQQEAKDVRVMRYTAPRFPTTVTPRQVALYALKTLGCSERRNFFVRVEAYDPGAR